MILVGIKGTELIRIQHIQFLGNKRSTDVTIILHLVDIHSFSLFGSNQNHTIRTARTIDSGSRTVLQHIHTLHIFRSHSTEFARNSINQHQGGCIGSTNGICTTKTYLSTSRRVTIRICDSQTGYFSLNQLSHILHGSFYKVIGFHTSYRTGYIPFTLCTVTNHHHFVQGLGILF